MVSDYKNKSIRLPHIPKSMIEGKHGQNQWRKAEPLIVCHVTPKTSAWRHYKRKIFASGSVFRVTLMKIDQGLVIEKVPLKPFQSQWGK